MKYLIDQFLQWDKKQRVSIIILVILILTLAVSRSFIAEDIPKGYFSDTLLEKKINPFIQHTEEIKTFPSQEENSTTPQPLFLFNPNTISEKEWLQLGVNAKTIRTIKNYLNKNGHFYKPEDLKKIYGFSETTFLKLKPYIVIPNAKTSSFNTEKNSSSEEKNKYTNLKQNTTIVKVNINTTELSDWVQIKGIGIKLGERILNYKNLLGGFYSIEQIKEIYGISNDLYESMKQNLFIDSPSTITKINLHTVAFTTLAKHPYIKYTLAKVILAYIQQHKDFKHIDELKNIKIISEEQFLKMKPYLTTN